MLTKKKSLSDNKKSLDKSEMEKKENVGINSETRQFGVLKGFDDQDRFKIFYQKSRGFSKISVENFGRKFISKFFVWPIFGRK